MKKKLLIIHFDEPEMAYETHIIYDYIIVVFDDGKFIYTKEAEGTEIRTKVFDASDLGDHIRAFCQNKLPRYD